MRAASDAGEFRHRPKEGAALRRAADGLRRGKRGRLGVSRGLAVLALADAASGCGAPVLTPAGPVGEGERQILFDSVAIMLTIVVPVILATLAFAWWFRASNPRARRRPDWAYSGRIELVVWSIPLLTIMFLGGVIWVGAHKLDPYAPAPSVSRENPFEVEVVSLDWKWLFIYPGQGVASVNTLVAPAGRPIHFRLTSGSVMTSFFVPRLGSMIYTMNGMATQLTLQADRLGDYQGLASHFSGDGFPGMHFVLHAERPSDFDAWVQSARRSGPVLDRGGYMALARQSADVAPFTYRAVDADLFRDILAQVVGPAPGPTTGRPSPTVSPKSVRLGALL